MLSCTRHHILTAFLQQFGLPCSAFTRRYLRNHYCFLLSPLTKMLQSSGFPILSDRQPKLARSRIRRLLVQRPLTPTQELSQFAAFFIGVWNRAIHLLAYYLNPLKGFKLKGVGKCGLNTSPKLCAYTPFPSNGSSIRASYLFFPQVSILDAFRC